MEQYENFLIGFSLQIQEAVKEYQDEQDTE